MHQSQDKILTNAYAYPARPNGRVTGVPTAKFIQEARYLGRWVVRDKKALVAAGLDWRLVESLPERADALRRAESDWKVMRLSRGKARQDWNRRAPQVNRLRADLLHTFRFAYRDQSSILKMLTTLEKEKRYAAIIQDIKILAALGLEHPEPLRAIGFDPDTLKDTWDEAFRMIQLQSEVFAEIAYNQAKANRDQAYVHLKEAVSLIRKTGRYVFWKDPKRLAGYSSQYTRQHRIRRKN